MQQFIPDTLPVGIEYSASLVAEIVETNRALSYYNALVEQSPSSQLILGLLVRREAMLSSRIEGTLCTLNEIFQFEEEDENPAVKEEQRDDLNEIINYVSALRFGEEQLGDRAFSISMLKDLHAKLLGTSSVRGQKKHPGRFRTEQNWIGPLGMTSMEQATFIPPEPAMVPKLMDNWEKFYHSRQPDELVQVAILHAQLELIHPFEDGNGRIGRLIIPLFLYEKKVISLPNFYPSAQLEKKRENYMTALRGLNTKPIKWDGWIWFFLQAVKTQAKEDSERVKRILGIYEDMKKRFVDLTRSQFAIPVLDAIFERPVFRRKGVEKNLKTLGNPPSVPTLVNLLNKLVKEKVLEVVTEGKGRRGTVYALAELMELLESSE